MKREQLIKTLKTLVPAGIEVTDEALNRADAALADNAAVITYLRGDHKVERVPVEVKDAPPSSKLIICAGEPKAVLIAFVAGEKLYIGWAKRNEDKDLLWNDAFDILKAAKTQDGVAFYDAVNKFMKVAVMKDKETAFSKQIGRYLAFLCACKETITFKGNRAYSTRCGLLPDLVAKRLNRFLARAEKVAGMKAANVKYESKAKVASA